MKAENDIYVDHRNNNTGIGGHNEQGIEEVSDYICRPTVEI